MKNGVRPLIAVLPFLLSGGSLSAQTGPVAPQKAITPGIVMEEVKKLVLKYDYQVGVVGSAVKGKKYSDPIFKVFDNVSDVDMTLIIEGIDDEGELLRRWSDFHDELRSNVRSAL